MIETFENQKTLSVTEFKAHCTEQLRAVEEQRVTLEITRHGKVIALVEPAPVPRLRSLGELMGTAAELVTIADDAEMDEPAWDDDEWEMHGGQDADPA